MVEKSFIVIILKLKICRQTARCSIYWGKGANMKKQILILVSLLIILLAGCSSRKAINISDELLFEAIENKDYKTVKQVLKSGVDINKISNDMGTSIAFAGMFSNDVKMLKLILKYKPDFEVMYDTGDYSSSLLTGAIIFDKSPQIVSALLKAGADPNGTKLEKNSAVPIVVAVLADDLEVVKILTKHKVKVNVIVRGLTLTSMFFYTESSENSAEILTLLLKNGLKVDSIGMHLERAKAEKRVKLAEVLQKEHDRLVEEANKR